MSKILLEAPFRGFRGKICKHAEIIFCKRKQTQYTTQICNPRTSPPTESELLTRTNFATAQQRALADLADATKRAEWQEKFDKQKKYTDLRGFIVAEVIKTL